MRYSPTHKEQTRQKLLGSSGALAKRGGFATVGVDGLMKAIGLTGGAFYSHYESKQEFFKDVVSHELSNSLIGKITLSENFSKDELAHCLAKYLILPHVQDHAGGCVIPSLGAEIARAEYDVREIAESKIDAIKRAWAEVLHSDNLAWIMLSQCVGAVLLARMMANAEAQEQVLEASRDFLGEILKSQTKTDQ
jgi:AcrR family transcriptional regulator